MPRPAADGGEHLAARDRAEGADQAPVAPEAPAAPCRRWRRSASRSRTRAGAAVGDHREGRRDAHPARLGEGAQAPRPRRSSDGRRAARHGESTPPSSDAVGLVGERRRGRSSPSSRRRPVVEGAPAQRAHAHERAGHRQVAAAELPHRGGRALGRGGHARDVRAAPVPRGSTSSIVIARRPRAARAGANGRAATPSRLQSSPSSSKKPSADVDERKTASTGSLGDGRGGRRRAEVDREVDRRAPTTGRVRRGNGDGPPGVGVHRQRGRVERAAASAKRIQPPVTASSAPARTARPTAGASRSARSSARSATGAGVELVGRRHGGRVAPRSPARRGGRRRRPRARGRTGARPATGAR